MKAPNFKYRTRLSPPSFQLLFMIIQSKQAASRRLFVCVGYFLCLTGQQELEHWVHGNTFNVCACVLVTTVMLRPEVRRSELIENRLIKTWLYLCTHAYILK